VAALVKAPAGRAGRPSKSLTLEQAQDLLRAAAGSRLYAYVVLSVTTGLRTEELRALRWSEIDLDAGTVAVYRAVGATADTKTPKSRRVLSLPWWLPKVSVSIASVRPRTGCWPEFSGKITV
jgi:integrase